jgi:predicted phosphodiesterase
MRRRRDRVAADLHPSCRLAIEQWAWTMRFAAIADIHGNCVALEAVLADIAAMGIADIVNLGDHVSGPLEAQRTADLLIDRGILSIQGDQDRRLVELDRAGSSDRADYKQLARRHLDWLASLPPTRLYRDDVFLCHGTPNDDAAYWLDRVTESGIVHAASIEDVETEALGIAASLMLCAHTHIPRVMRLRDGRLVVNPGSVGCPGYTYGKPVAHKVQTGTPDATYAILEQVARGWSVTFRYVPYDHLPMANLARRNGSAEWANAIATGWLE